MVVDAKKRNALKTQENYSDYLDEYIKKLSEFNVKQFSFAEYKYVKDLILKKAPCNILVFGLGYDSELWSLVNENESGSGITVFLEDDKLWIDKIKSRYSDRMLDIEKITYTTKLKDFERILFDERKLKISLSERVLNTQWDVIIVDGPRGDVDDAPGRMQSIYAASLLAKNNPYSTDVFIHDFNRMAEKKYSLMYLGEKNIVYRIERLANFRIGNSDRNIFSRTIKRFRKFFDNTEDSLLPKLIHREENIFNVKIASVLPRDNRSYDLLPGTIWGITTFFNYNNYKNKLKNYRLFRQHNRRQGLKLLTVELAFNDDKFELTKKDADILIQLRTTSILWQKERLLNIALDNLPKDCDKVVWLDCDIILENDDWVTKTAKLLEEYKVVQPYSKFIRMKKNVLSPDIKEYAISKGFMGKNSGYGRAYGRRVLRDDCVYYHPGFIWAIRRKIIDKHRFYDKMILGSGDRILTTNFYQLDNGDLENILPPSLLSDISRWGREFFKDIRNSVTYVDGMLLHLWHGERNSRFYIHRHRILGYFDYDPHKDIMLDSNNCWIWASNKPNFHRMVKVYFWIRNEEDRLFPRIVASLYLFSEKKYVNIFLRKIYHLYKKVTSLLRPVK